MNPYLIDYGTATTSKILSVICLFVIAVGLLFGSWFLNRRLEKRIKQNKKLKKDYYEDEE